MTQRRADSEVSSDPMITAEERFIYRLAPYAILFPIGRAIAQRFAPDPIASAAVVFLFVLGFWWIDKAKRQKISFPVWIGISVLAALTVFVFELVLARLWPNT